MAEAASVPMSAHTVWQALFEHGMLAGEFPAASVPHVNEEGEAILHQADGKRVLILGASGGVGLLAVQIRQTGWCMGRWYSLHSELGVFERIGRG